MAYQSAINAIGMEICHVAECKRLGVSANVFVAFFFVPPLTSSCSLQF